MGMSSFIDLKSNRHPDRTSSVPGGAIVVENEVHVVVLRSEQQGSASGTKDHKWAPGVLHEVAQLGVSL